MTDVEKKIEMETKQEQSNFNEIDERKFCLGEECPDKNCRICPAASHARFVLDITDSYRRAVPTGYYTSTVMSYKDPVTGKTKYCYTRPD